jgi:hypothetical protein
MLVWYLINNFHFHVHSTRECVWVISFLKLIWSRFSSCTAKVNEIYQIQKSSCGVTLQVWCNSTYCDKLNHILFNQLEGHPNRRCSYFLQEDVCRLQRSLYSMLLQSSPGSHQEDIDLLMFMTPWGHSFHFQGQTLDLLMIMSPWGHSFHFQGQTLDLLMLMSPWGHSFHFQGQTLDLLMIMSPWGHSFHFQGQTLDLLMFMSPWGHSFHFQGQTLDLLMFMSPWGHSFHFQGQTLDLLMFMSP